MNRGLSIFVICIMLICIVDMCVGLVLTIGEYKKYYTDKIINTCKLIALLGGIIIITGGLIIWITQLLH